VRQKGREEGGGAANRVTHLTPNMLLYSMGAKGFFSSASCADMFSLPKKAASGERSDLI
jgi:hypothetical protein